MITPELYIGIMSGTSMDGIDTALVEFKNQKIKLLASYNHSIPVHLKKRLKALCLDQHDTTIDMLGEADSELGQVFADAVNRLLQQSEFNAGQIRAIGSHGQTIRHRPDLEHSFSLQIGDANRISYACAITTVADFRRKDMAAGGEGAPLTPIFHQEYFSHKEQNRAVVNIGGIANITFLPKNKNKKCFGFDTGPGNMLMDAWTQRHKNKNFDYQGEWAASSNIDPDLLEKLMQDPFIKSAPPKSTGREHYHLGWLEKQLKNFPHLNESQVQSSLCQFTCDSIVYAIQTQLPQIDRLIICGGGIHNKNLLARIANQLPDTIIESSEQHGIHPDWLEAMAFAWLARQTMLGLTGNMTSVTGAKKAVILGSIFPA